MAEPVIHVMIEEHPGYGWAITSPQLPELVAGRDTAQDLRRDMLELLKFGGAPAEYKLVTNIQSTQALGDELFVIRARIGPGSQAEREAREVVSQRLQAVLDDPLNRTDMMDTYKSPSGEATFVASLNTDKISYVIGQLANVGDAITVVLSIDDLYLWTSQVVFGVADEESTTLDDYGLTTDSTLGELHAAMASESDPHRRLLAV